MVREKNLVSNFLGKIIVISGIGLGLFFLGVYRPDKSFGNKKQEHVLVDAQTGNSLVIVNVLDIDQYHDCHIKNSINVEFNDLEKFAQSLDKNTEVVFYCSNYMCAGSGKAAKLFKERGFTHVWAYEAGMAEWYKQGLPVDGECKAKYLNMKNEPLDLPNENFDTITTSELKNKLGF